MMGENNTTIVFIHGLFMNPKSWQPWMDYFSAKGYQCHAPAYPYHEGEPAALRKQIDPKLGLLTFGQVVESLVSFLDTLPPKPVLVGHSMGGLAVQKLMGMGKGAAGICIDPAPPQGIFSFKWSFLKANLTTINPFKGNSAFLPSVNWYHYAFCNTMTLDETKIEYDKYVVPESRNIARSTLGDDGAVDFSKPHAPLLFIAGEKDNIVPASLIKNNFDAYKESGGKKEFKQFAGRSHFICNQTGWEEVAGWCDEWIKNNL